MSYMVDRSLPMDVQIRNALEALLGLRAPSGTVTFTANATATDQVVLSDGVTATTYEFYSVTVPDSPKVGVLIGGSKEATATALGVAVNAQADNAGEIDPDRALIATVVSAVVSLENSYPGISGNVAITTVEDSECMTIVGMVGGANGGSIGGVVPSNAVGLAQVSVSTDAWTSVTLPAGTVQADVMLVGEWCWVVCQDAQPADADTGCLYAPNIGIRLQTSGRAKIWVRRQTATVVTVHTTASQG